MLAGVIVVAYGCALWVTAAVVGWAVMFGNIPLHQCIFPFLSPPMPGEKVTDWFIKKE